MTTQAPPIGPTLARCERVAAGAEAVKALFAAIMPFAGNDLNDLSLQEQAGTTAFIKRFEQLQDLLARLVRLIAGWEGVDAGSMSQRDLGDWLEKRFLAVEAIEWMVAARLRNRLVHEYPIEEEEQVRRLNECWALMPLLQTITVGLAAYCRQKGYA